MLLSEPGKTNYDFHFKLFGFDIRTHPGFFILPILFGAQGAGEMNPGVAILIFAAVLYLSILIHELGHTFAFRYFGIPSRVVLYWMGGLAIPDNSWGKKGLRHTDQIVVSVAGPIAGILLGCLLVGIVYAIGGQMVWVKFGEILPLPLPYFEGSMIENNVGLMTLLNYGIFFNIFWSFINLLPVIPLDGGQVCREVCLINRPNDGIRIAYMVSIATAIFLAVVGFAAKSQFMGIFFAFMAYSSFQALQQISNRGGGRW